MHFLLHPATLISGYLLFGMVLRHLLMRFFPNGYLYDICRGDAFQFVMLWPLLLFGFIAVYLFMAVDWVLGFIFGTHER